MFRHEASCIDANRSDLKAELNDIGVEHFNRSPDNHFLLLGHAKVGTCSSHTCLLGHGRLR
jgi:hypothetical protein